MEEYWSRLEKNILPQCPSFCRIFIEEMKVAMMKDSTLYVYCLDLMSFLEFLTLYHSKFIHLAIPSFTIKDMEEIDEQILTDYLNYLSFYTDKNGIARTNSDYAKARKLSVIRALFTFYKDRGELSNGAPILFHYPKLYCKEPAYISQTDIEKLFCCVKTGIGLSGKEKEYHNYTCARDLAVITILLGTGITCQELVQLNLDDLNSSMNRLRVIRRGTDETLMTIPCDIIEIADKYIKLRSEKKNDNNENALFLSLQGTRMTSRAIEKMVRKYGEIAIPTVNLSPQILRDTFGSMLYKKSGGNLYVVAEALGVRDINTVRRRYSKLDITEANIPHVIKV